MSTVVPFEASAIEDAARALFPYGGEELGFVVEPPKGAESRTAQYTNRQVSEAVVEALGRSTKEEFKWVEEGTREFASVTEEHTDGLNIEDYYLQTHTLHRGDREMSSRFVLRTYTLDDEHMDLARDIADRYNITDSQIEARDMIPQFDASRIRRGSPEVVRRVLVQPTLHTVVFVNGYPGESLTPARKFPTHAVDSLYCGQLSDYPREATFARVERVPAVGTRFN